MWLLPLESLESCTENDILNYHSEPSKENKAKRDCMKCLFEKKKDKGQTFSRAKYFTSLVALNLLRAQWEYIFSAYIREWTSLPWFGILISTFLGKCMFNLHGCASCVYAGGLPFFQVSEPERALQWPLLTWVDSHDDKSSPQHVNLWSLAAHPPEKKKSNAVKNVTLTVLHAPTAHYQRHVFYFLFCHVTEGHTVGSTNVYFFVCLHSEKRAHEKSTWNSTVCLKFCLCLKSPLFCMRLQTQTLDDSFSPLKQQSPA